MSKTNATNAARQARYKQRREDLWDAFPRLRDAILGSLDRGRCSRTLDNLPEDPVEWAIAAAAILEERRLIACKLED